MQILAFPKINLCLDILKKTATGYHEIQTVFHELKISPDEIEISKSQEEDHLSIAQGDEEDLIKMKDNLAFRALKLFKKRFQIDKNASIHIVKNIPLAAGLGGASSDAAAVLKGLNELWELRLSEEQLMALGAELGMDVPFFILGGTALGTHFGEKITALKPIQNLDFKITDKIHWPILPRIKGQNKTESMYRALDLKNCGKKTARTEALLKAIEANDAQGILENIHNDFESIVPLEKDQHLSGSGPAVFTATLT